MTTSAAWLALPLPPDPSSGRPFVVTGRYGTRDGAHHGIDLATRDANGTPTTGLPVFAVVPGVIARTPDDYSGGTMVVLRTRDGAEVKYAHLSRRDVRVGDVVAAGQVLGLSGRSGVVNGPHLHLEFWWGGSSVDPLPSLQQIGTGAGAAGGGGGGLVAVGLVGLGLFLFSRRKR